MSEVVILSNDNDHYSHKLLQNLKFRLYTDILRCFHIYFSPVKYDKTVPLGKYA